MCRSVTILPFCAYALSINRNLSKQIKKRGGSGASQRIWALSKIVGYCHSTGSCRNTQRQNEGVWRDRKQSKAQAAHAGTGAAHPGGLDVCYSPPLKGSAKEMPLHLRCGLREGIIPGLL